MICSIKQFRINSRSSSSGTHTDKFVPQDNGRKYCVYYPMNRLINTILLLVICLLIGGVSHILFYDLRYVGFNYFLS